VDDDVALAKEEGGRRLTLDPRTQRENSSSPTESHEASSCSFPVKAGGISNCISAALVTIQAVRSNFLVCEVR